MMNLSDLKEHCGSCSECGLFRTRTNVVFGVGPENAQIMFIGEGPGQQEDLSGEPFVGAAGLLLNEMLSIIELGRHNCYIANIVKCRPPMNRDPLEEEQNACIPYLYEQIQIIRPKLMVCLGRIAAMKLIRSDFRITKEHGIWYEYNGIPIMATFHPSALLRDPSKRPDAFRDLLSLRNKITELSLVI